MDPLTAALRPFARGWLRRVQQELSLLPAPSGAPRQQIRGVDTDRILIFGNGPATGFGVLTQELGLPGQLAREVRRRTGRGVEVDLARGRGFTIASAPDRFARVRPSRYDAVIVTIGATDAGALIPEALWEASLRRLIDIVRSSVPATAPIVVLGIRPQATAHQGVGLLNALVDRHASRLDAITARVTAASRTEHFVAIEPALREIGERRYFSVVSYRAIALRIAMALAPDLDLRHEDGSWADGRRAHAHARSEEGRQRAVDELAPSTPQSEERLQRLVTSASNMFGTAGAALTIIDRNRQIHRASVGLDGAGLPRQFAVCDRTIQQDEALIVADVTADPRTVGTDMRADGDPVRFYAGYPIESPDGYRLGALCVFDTDARDPADVDEGRLRELAQLVQNELWDLDNRIA